jgi:hypothetical protein
VPASSSATATKTRVRPSGGKGNLRRLAFDAASCTVWREPGDCFVILTVMDVASDGAPPPSGTCIAQMCLPTGSWS